MANVGPGHGYYLVPFDADGRERPAPDGSLMSDAVIRRIGDRAAPVSHVFLMSHGWMGDVPAAVRQYDAWVGTMAAALRNPPDFVPLVIGLHWPSLPWGDETLPPSGGLLSAAPQRPSIEAEISAYAAHIADTQAARDALRTILQAARLAPEAADLSPSVRDAYSTLFLEAGLRNGAVTGAPPDAAAGADLPQFDPAAIIAGAHARAAAPGLLGWQDDLRDLALMPLRQLSFWKMKDRALAFGESGARTLLGVLQQQAPQAAQFHLMGHSFGCIVQSAAVAGRPGGGALPRPVDSLFLVQGALSLWSFAEKIPFMPGSTGYFRPLLHDRLVAGPIVTTRSKFDKAVGRYYPIGAGFAHQVLLGESLPVYGGVGSFGAQGLAGAHDMPIQSEFTEYNFQAGQLYNLDASSVIKNGGGAAGAHSDIAHPEVAHVVAQMVRAPRRQAGKGIVLGAIADEYLGAGAPRGGLGPSHAADRSNQQQQRQQEQQWQYVPRGEGGAGQTQQRQDQQNQDGGVGGTIQRQQRQEMQQQQQIDAPTLRQYASTRTAQIADPIAAETTAAAAPPAQRVINAELEDQPPDQPLVKNGSYTLAFGVDMAANPQAVATTPLADENLFEAGQDEVVLTIQLDSASFDISDRSRPLRLPRTGRSRNKARFDVTPLQDGPSTLKATIHKDGNFIQQMDLTFDVGAAKPTPATVVTRGRPLSSATVVQPRHASLNLSLDGDGYECIVVGGKEVRARIPLQPAALASAIDAARQELMKVVNYTDANGAYIFQTQVEIQSSDARKFALETMARAGARLFQKLFFGPGAGADANTVGKFLRQLTSDPRTRLKLQIVASDAPVPWGLLYMGDASEGAVLDWEKFIGMRHVIEQIPLQNTATVPDWAISSEPALAVSLNLNSTIDVPGGTAYVANQQAFWTAATKNRQHLRVTPRTTRAEVKHALADAATDDQILYFYCHGATAGLNNPGGPDESRLIMSDAAITLGELYLDAPTDTLLRGSPLVFINACESAEMSPAFYDGFVPYFMAKGARGVVGTECMTPGLFAASWARQFFERFLDGAPLGETFLDLRRSFQKDQGNPLGLLYAVHCDADTVIQPALKEAA